MTRCSFNFAMAAALVGAWCAATPAAPPDRQWTLRYELIDLGTLGGQQSQAVAMSDSGFVVGWAETGDQRKPATHAFMWNQGVMTDLGTLGGESSEALGVNDRGQVIGVSQTRAGDVHGFIWYGGVMRSLNDMIRWQAGPQQAAAIPMPDPMTLSGVASINNYGVIVGTAAVPGHESVHGFVLMPDASSRGLTYGALDLGALPGFEGCTPYAINDDGVVVGVSGTMAFQWERGTMFALDQIARTVLFESRATAISNRGLVVGWYAEGADPHEACLWQQGAHVALDGGGGFYHEAAGVNGREQIVGWNYTALGPTAVMWEGRACTDLNDVTAIPLRAGFVPLFPWAHLVSAAAIDEAGWIAGYGASSEGLTRAFLLKPYRVAAY